MISLGEIDIDNQIMLSLLEKAELMSFAKGEMVLQQGQVCSHLYLIDKGMLRNFYYDTKGNDITHWFSSERTIDTIPPSFFKRAPSSFLMEAIEDTEVKALSYDQFEATLKEHPSLERLGRLLVTEIMMALGQKIIDLQTKTAKERYDELLDNHPNIFKRAKLSHIAGYLGITQQSLSRIRAEN